MVNDFDVASRASARGTMRWLGGLAIAVVVAATVGLVFADQTSTTPPPPDDVETG